MYRPYKYDQGGFTDFLRNFFTYKIITKVIKALPGRQALLILTNLVYRYFSPTTGT